MITADGAHSDERAATECSYAAVAAGPYGDRYKFVSSEVPTPGPGEAVVRIDYSGVCHGDVYSRDGGGPAPPQPLRPLIGGHEGVGRVVRVGKSTQPAFSVGDLVGIAWRSRTCGACDACRCGAENHCLLQQIVGMHRDGTFQTHVLFPMNALVRVPSEIDGPQACPVLCAGVTGYVALRKMHPVPGKWCVISGGAGGVGHLAIQYAKKVFKLKVLAIDGGSSKEAFCREMGCDEYVDFTEEGDNLVRTVLEHTGGGADYVLILSPHQAAYDAAGDYARFRAQIMAVGIGNCSFPLRPILQKDLTVRSSETGTLSDIKEALSFTAKGIVKTKTEVMDFLELNEAVDRVKAGKVMGKLVLDVRSARRQYHVYSEKPMAVL